MSTKGGTDQFLIGLNLVDDMNGVVVFLGVMAWIIDLALAFYIALSFFYYLGQGVRYSEASSAPVSVVEKK